MWALCPVLLRVRVRVRVCVVALLHRSWPRQWLRVRPGCASGPASVLAAPVAPAVKRRSFTASPPAVKRCKVCCKTLQLQFYSRAASPPSCKTLRSFAAAVLQPSCVRICSLLHGAACGIGVRLSVRARLPGTPRGSVPERLPSVVPAAPFRPPPPVVPPLVPTVSPAACESPSTTPCLAGQGHAQRVELSFTRGQRCG